MRESRERKKQKKREYNARFYVKNKDNILKDRKEERRKKRPRIVVEQERERRQKTKKTHLQMFLFHLMLSEEHFQQEPLENELLALQEHIFQVVKEKSCCHCFSCGKSHNTACSPATGISELARKPRGRKNGICSFRGC